MKHQISHFHEGTAVILIGAVFVLERPARLVMGSFIIGMSICLYTSEINSVVYEFIGNTMDYFSTYIPILYFWKKRTSRLAG